MGSLRDGHRYGTALVDLERNRLVDLLPDRQADTLAGWLRQHPGVEIVARDRAGAYADGVRQGAPDAVQVADRWHLLRNLGDAVRAVIDRQHAAIRRAAKQAGEQERAPPQPPPAAAPDSPRPSAAAQRSQASLARRQVRYEDAARLHAAGASIARIAAQLCAERKTVRRWLRAGGPSLWRKPPRVGGLAPYLDRLERRWTEGCRNAALLWRELIPLGFTGRPGTVRRWAGQRRKAEPHTAAGLANAPLAHGQPPSSREVARMLMADTGTLSETGRTFISSLLAQVVGIAESTGVAKRLNLLLRHKSQESLAGVLDDAAGTLLANFAASMRRTSRASGSSVRAEMRGTSGSASAGWSRSVAARDTRRRRPSARRTAMYLGPRAQTSDSSVSRSPQSAWHGSTTLTSETTRFETGAARRVRLADDLVPASHGTELRKPQRVISARMGATQIQWQ